MRCFFETSFTQPKRDAVFLWKRKIASVALFFLFSFSSLLAQDARTITVKGFITSQGGEPLGGVNISVKGTSKVVTTQVDGAYHLDASPNDVLVISFVGYLTKEIKLGSSGSDKLNIQLLPKKNEMNEVIVLGYGTRKK